MHNLNTSSESVNNCSKKCGFQCQLAIEDSDRSEDDPVTCASDYDDMNEVLLSASADVPFSKFVAVVNDVPMCKP